MGAFTTVGLSACGAPAYTYVADSAAGTFFKVPSQWHQISQHDLNAALAAAGSSTATGSWSAAFDADPAPAADHNSSIALAQPFTFAEVGNLSATASSAISYNSMRDIWLPVTSATRTTDASEGFTGTNFTPLRDQMITAKQGVHGVRETFQYTFGKTTDTFDEEVLTNADQTVVYVLQVHCTEACYVQNENSINTVMSSFTIGSPT